MPTKSELEGRVSRIVQIFQKAMPAVSTPYPSVIICTQRTYRGQRAFLVSRIGSEAISAPTEDKAVELISGKKGTALLVRKEQVPSLDSFYHLLWVALGRFYLSATTSDTLTSDEWGAAFWSVFAPEAIANRVERFLRTASGDTEKEIKWPEEQWRAIYDELKLGLLAIYGKRNIQFPELAFHFAACLTDDLLCDMIRQARGGKFPGREGHPFDPVCVEMMPVEMRKPMEQLIATLEAQMEKERYWEADEQVLTQIGELLKAMNGAYVELIADELIRDEVDAAPIPKELPDLDEDLPEID